MHIPDPTSLAVPWQQDRALASAAMAGDPAAFEAIVRHNNRLLFRTARGIVSDDEAQDVVQETYLRAFTRLGTYRGDAALGTWLARIAINVALTVQRRRKPLESFNVNDDGDMEAEMIPAPDEHAPDSQAGGQELRTLLQASIAELPPIYRSVFMLRAVEEMSVADTAWCLGVSAEVVKTRFLRARALLRERLASRVESGARDTFGFAGARCDAVLAHVMADLARLGLLRAD